MTYLLDGFRGPPSWIGGPGRVPSPKSLLLPLQCLTQVKMWTRTREVGPHGPGGFRVLATGARRPAVDGANVTTGRGPPSNLGTRESTGDQAQRRVWKGRREKTLETLTASAAVLRLFLSRLGSYSMFSFGPTSGAQRCLIVRDWEPPVPRLENSAAHAGNARPAQRAARRPAPSIAPRPLPPRWLGG